MKIDPSETIIEGKWLVNSRNRIIGNENCERIHDLKENHLVFITTDESGWDSLYQDPTDGRFWEHTYPQSHLHGGGPPTLRNLTPIEAKEKYGLDENFLLPKQEQPKWPCLFPWYFDKDEVRLNKDGVTWQWKTIGTCGTYVLADEEDNWYAVISPYTYMLVANDKKSFLLWKRKFETAKGIHLIHLFYYEVDKLQPITGQEKILSRLEKSEASCSIKVIKKKKVETLLAVDPTIKIEVAFNPRYDGLVFDFPEEFKRFGEFIVITEFENLYENPAPDWQIQQCF